MVVFSSINGGYIKDRLCSRTSFKLKEVRFRQDIRKKHLMMKHGNRLPRELVDAPSLKRFKARLDRALINLV